MSKCRGCKKELIYGEYEENNLLKFRVRTNEEIIYHTKCALHYVVQDRLDHEYGDPYYD